MSNELEKNDEKTEMEAKVISDNASEKVKKIKDKLTPEEDALQKPVADEWIARSIGGCTDVDEDVIQEGFRWLYKISNIEPPDDVEIYDSPQAAVREAKKCCAEVNNTHYIGLMADSYWVAFYDFFTRIGVIDEENFNKYRDLLKAGVWDCICLDKKAFVIRRPNLVKQDDAKRLHNAEGPAMSFIDGFEIYVWHGIMVPKKLIMEPDSYTKDELLAETNSEIRRAYSERVGIDKYAEKIGTKVIDSWTDPNTQLTYELLDFENRDGDMQPRLLKMRSPQTKNGDRPFYIEPVDPGLKTAKAARKWQFPLVGAGLFTNKEAAWPSVDDCNKNPEISFVYET